MTGVALHKKRVLPLPRLIAAVLLRDRGRSLHQARQIAEVDLELAELAAGIVARKGRTPAAVEAWLSEHPVEEA